MTELGIICKCPLVHISAGVGNFLVSYFFFYDPKSDLKFLIFHLFTFCNIIMTGEPTHTTSKERMEPELMFSSERVPQLSSTDLKVKWPLH